jgi:hypothetical protein
MVECQVVEALRQHKDFCHTNRFVIAGVLVGAVLASRAGLAQKRHSPIGSEVSVIAPPGWRRIRDFNPRAHSIWADTVQWQVYRSRRSWTTDVQRNWGRNIGPEFATGFPRNFDRLSSPEANSCIGCHNAPIAWRGGESLRVLIIEPFESRVQDHRGQCQVCQQPVCQKPDVRLLRWIFLQLYGQYQFLLRLESQQPFISLPSTSTVVP